MNDGRLTKDRGFLPKNIQDLFDWAEILNRRITIREYLIRKVKSDLEYQIFTGTGDAVPILSNALLAAMHEQSQTSE